MVTNQQKIVVEYLEVRGASFSGQTVGNAGILTFALNNETRENGRLLAKKDGSVSVWHISAPKGLSLPSQFEKSDNKTIGNREVTSYTIKPEKIEQLIPTTEPIRRIENTKTRPIQKTYDKSSFENAVRRELEQAGWKYQREQGGIQYWNDGSGSTAAERVVIGEGIASVWSFRSDVDLPEPFQRGSDTKGGMKSMYVTAKDLEVQTTGYSTVKERPVKNEREPINQATVNFVKESWNLGLTPNSDHPQLVKAGATLEGDFLKRFPDNEKTREKYMTRDLLAPVFRPDGKGGVELAGGQRLMNQKYMGNDKLLLSGTQSVGAFMPIPVAPLMNDKPNIQDWVKSLGDDAKTKPLVIVEGVSTGLAINQTKAGNVLVAITSNNLVNVAKWVKETGLDQHFPKGVVIAADLDFARHANGNLKSNAIPKAVEAAKVVGAKVAVAKEGNEAGTDARDLMGKHGEQEVRNYVEQAIKPEMVFERQDLKFMKELIKEKQQEITR